MPKKWNFLRNYGLVLTHLVQNPRATLREIARGTDLTERAVYQIVRDLEVNGFIQKRREGRRNIYTVNEGALFSFPVYQQLNIAQMITALRRMMEERRNTATNKALLIRPEEAARDRHIHHPAWTARIRASRRQTS